MASLQVGERALVALSDLASHAVALWREVRVGGVVWLTGELGAGKTAFVTAVTSAAGAERARSPTFALIHEYPAVDGLVVHVDCYRLRSPQEALDLDLLALSAGARLTLIEWPERAGPFAPEPDAHLHFSHADDADHRLLERVV
jgi:tRNA threonylcarbamoyladenosine biosynthesis protein TsaE